MTGTRLSFAASMEEALYGPKGYYATGVARSGREGDYFTAPDTGPAFGVLLAALFQQWGEQFAAQPFALIEAGAGEGKLARDILKAHPFPYTAVERSPARREKLKAIPGVRVFGSLTEIPDKPAAGCLLSNELIDALPVHRVRVREGRFEEAFIENDQWVWDAPSTPQIAAYFQRLGITLPEGYETEVNLAMADWMQEAAQTIHSGFVVVIDYGRPAWAYYAPERNGGTLRGFKGHEVVGPTHVSGATSLDWTSDVDFTSLALDGREAGLTPLAFMELGSFLLMGARAMLEANPKAKAPAGLRYLVHPEGMGGAFHVLILGKGLNAQDWTFEGNRLQRLNPGLRPAGTTIK